MEVGEDNACSVGERLGLPGQCDGKCGENIDALEAMLDKVAKIVEMLVAAGELSSPAARLVVEKHKGKMAREWDESVSQATDRAKADAVVKGAEKRMCKKAEQESTAGEVRVQPEKVVQVKEAAGLAATAERDRMVEAATGCTDGPAMMATAERL